MAQADTPAMLVAIVAAPHSEVSSLLVSKSVKRNTTMVAAGAYRRGAPLALCHVCRMPFILSGFFLLDKMLYFRFDEKV